MMVLVGSHPYVNCNGSVRFKYFASLAVKPGVTITDSSTTDSKQVPSLFQIADTLCTDEYPCVKELLVFMRSVQWILF